MPNDTTTYAVRYSHTSSVEIFASLDAALAAVRAVHPGCWIDTDALPEARALVWERDEAAQNDDGSRALASISARVSEEG